MSKKNPSVLIVAPSLRAKGGITSVIKILRQGEQWDRFRCRWLGTYVEKNAFLKMIYFFKAFLLFFFYLPFYDIIHFHVASGPSLIRKAILFRIARLAGKKTIVHMHIGNQIELLGNSKRFRYIMKYADCVIVLSNATAEYIKRTFPTKNNIRVLYNPCKEVQEKKTSWEKYILFAGYLDANKGYRDLLKSFACISNKYEQWKLVFAGKGEIDEGKKLAEVLNIGGKVKFIGWITGEQKNEVFSKASALCLPSYAEGFPMVVLEAWAYGLPVICTPVGGLPDVIRDGENCLVFHPGNIEELSIALERIMADTSLRLKLSKNAIYLSKTRFEPRVICNELKFVYEHILG